jgi:CBS domain-containing protein
VEAPPLVAAATIDILRRHAPFDAMSPDDLGFLARHLKLRYFPEGATILSPASGTASTFFIIQRGRVHGEAAVRTPVEDAAFTLTEGECFPVGALIGRRPTTIVYRSGADTFCYTLEEARFRELLQRSAALNAFCTRRLAHLLERSRSAMRDAFAGRAGVELSMASPVGLAVRRPPVSLPETSELRDVLALMKARRIGSVVLTDAAGCPSGIFTRTDVLDRVALAGLELSVPVASVMTRDPVGVASASPAVDAAELMARRGFRHLLVLDGERLVGVVSERDLFSLQRRSLQGLRKEIRQADSVEALAFVAREVRGLGATMFAQGVSAEAILQFVTALNDAIVLRVTELAASDHGVDGLGWCWMGLGSEGRMEQTLATDQDNAIIFPDGDAADREARRQRLLAFADRANRMLDACGFPLCKGDIMARNPLWCLTSTEWAERFDGWMRNADPTALMNAAIFFDLRALAGDDSLVERLRDFLLAQVKDRPAFLRQMAANALQVRPPLGIFGDIRADDGTIDLKTQASRPFVDAARIFALATGVPDTSTAGRLRSAGERLRASPEESSSMVEAFHFIQMLRLRNQEEVERLGAGSPNRLDPSRLSDLDRRILRDALRRARKVQNRLALDYQL